MSYSRKWHWMFKLYFPVNSTANHRYLSFSLDGPLTARVSHLLDWYRFHVGRECTNPGTVEKLMRLGVRFIVVIFTAFLQWRTVSNASVVYLIGLIDCRTSLDPWPWSQSTCSQGKRNASDRWEEKKKANMRKNGTDVKIPRKRNKRKARTKTGRTNDEGRGRTRKW